MTPLPEISQYFLVKNMDANKFKFAKTKIWEGNYYQGLKTIFNKNNYVNSKK